MSPKNWARDHDDQGPYLNWVTVIADKVLSSSRLLQASLLSKKVKKLFGYKVDHFS